MSDFDNHLDNYGDPGQVVTPEPTHTWTCQDCDGTVERYRGEYDVTCECGAEYNAAGQRLRDNWRGNPSSWDSETGDLEGYEIEMGGDW